MDLLLKGIYKGRMNLKMIAGALLKPKPLKGPKVFRPGPTPRNGVGEALLEHARRFAQETGARALMLETATDNLTAQRLYERLGWVRETGFYTYYLRL